MVTGITVQAGPASGAAPPDHTAKPPANQEQFNAYTIADEGSCRLPVPITPSRATWTVSDIGNVKISSAQDATNGLATCVRATAGPVTVTATVTLDSFTNSGTSTITCK